MMEDSTPPGENSPQASQIYRLLVEHMNEGLIQIDNQNVIQFVNDRFCEMVGYTREELTGNDLNQILFDDAEQKKQLKKIRLRQRGISDRYETRVRKKNGEYIWVQVAGAPVKDERDQVVGAFGIHTDITERKLADQALRESERRYRILFDAAPDAVEVLDAQGIIMYSNPAHQKLVGYPPQEIEGKHTTDFFVDKTDLQRKLGKTLRTTGSNEGEFNILNQAGVIIPIWRKGKAIYNANDEFIGAVVFSRDLTNRKRNEQALQASEARYRNLFEDSPISLWDEDFSKIKLYIDALKNQGIDDFRAYFDANPEAVVECARLAEIKDVNDATVSLYKAQSKEHLLGQLDQVFRDETYSVFKEELITLAEGKTAFKIEIVNQTMQGEKMNVSLRLSIAPGYEDSWSQVFVSIIDITERVKAEQALRESEARYRTILESIQEIYFEVDLAGNFTFLNDHAGEIMGYSTEELMGMNNRDYTDEQNAAKLYEAFNRVYRTGQPLQGVDWEIITKDGAKRYLTSSVSLILNSGGDPTGFRGITQDISKRKEAEQRMEHLATHHSLTDLPNRILFHDRLNHALAQSKRNNSFLAVLFLDLDNLKGINDTYGHEQGDQFLQAMAERLKSCLRESDTVAHLSGDEFTFILENITDRENAASVTEKILAHLSQPFEIKGNETIVTASIGISFYPDDGEEVETLLRKADDAMYRVKKTGKNNYAFYS